MSQQIFSVEALFEQGAWVGTVAEWEALPEGLRVPFLATKVLPQLLDKTAAKSKDARKLAVETCQQIAEALSPYAVKVVLPTLLDFINPKRRPEQREVALQLLARLAEKHPAQMAWCLPEALPAALVSMTDVKPGVRKVAAATIAKLSATTGNRDLESFIPVVTRCLQETDFAADAIDRLASVVFVQAVEIPVLALMAPVLVRGLQTRKEPTKRKACKIIDNMVKLVPHSRELASFVPQLGPLVAKAKEEISDPEARGVAERVHVTLEDAGNVLDKAIDSLWLQQKLQEFEPNAEADTVVYATALSLALTASRCFEVEEWSKELSVLGLPQTFVEQAKELCYSAATMVEVEDQEEDGVDLCNCVFTLAYGNNTLLNNTRLHLKEGMCYALLGQNDCGKSTLMRAIDQEKVDGFPPKTEMRTAFVEHGIGEAEPECDMLPEEYICSEPSIKADLEAGILTREKVIEELAALGFEKGDKLDMPLGNMSGGWKMKTGLVRAALMRADILLLDEPTGHMDIKNVAWLTQYVDDLKRNPGRPVTVVMTSHDSKFLEKTCTHVINFEKRKLVMYKGKLSEFVEKVPSAKSYFELRSDKYKFTFPDPGALEGVKSRSKVVMRMSDVEFTYPSATKPVLHGVGVQVSMFSRVAIVGPNGSGKSTMIKCLLGELKPTSGTVWKIPGSRVAYMAQHAFHHLEAHLHLTPTQYVLQRFAGNEDNESLEYLAALGDHEQQAGPVLKMKYKGAEIVECESKFNSQGLKEYVEKDLVHALVLQQVVGRRRHAKKKGFEYEVLFTGSSQDTAWLEGDLLAKMGCKRETQREDEKQAAAAGLQKRPLTTPGVEKHFADFGVDAETATHTPMHSLSGGQKVKVVLGASMWLNPHLLILDEPTNYLDRDALGALTHAIEGFNGGVIVISHNSEFCDRICPEKWVMDAGNLSRVGDSTGSDEAVAATGGAKPAASTELYVDVMDASGCMVRQRTVAKTKKELQKEVKDLEKEMKAMKKGGTMNDDVQEKYWELEDKLNELKLEIDAKQ